MTKPPGKMVACEPMSARMTEWGCAKNYSLVQIRLSDDPRTTQDGLVGGGGQYGDLVRLHACIECPHGPKRAALFDKREIDKVFGRGPGYKTKVRKSISVSMKRFLRECGSPVTMSQIKTKFRAQRALTVEAAVTALIKGGFAKKRDDGRYEWVDQTAA